MLTLTCLLAAAAFVCAVLSFVTRVPLAAAVLLISIAELLHCVPVG